MTSNGDEIRDLSVIVDDLYSFMSKPIEEPDQKKRKRDDISVNDIPDDYYSAKFLSKYPRTVISDAIEVLWSNWSKIDASYLQQQAIDAVNSSYLPRSNVHPENYDEIIADMRVRRNVTANGVIIPRGLDIKDPAGSNVADMIKNISYYSISPELKDEYVARILEIFGQVPDYRQLLYQTIDNPLNLQAIKYVSHQYSRINNQQPSNFQVDNVVFNRTEPEIALNSIASSVNMTYGRHITWIVTITIRHSDSNEPDQIIEILSNQSFQELEAFIQCSHHIPSNDTRHQQHSSYFYLPQTLIVDVLTTPVDLDWGNPKLPQNLIDVDAWVQNNWIASQTCHHDDIQTLHTTSSAPTSTSTLPSLLPQSTSILSKNYKLKRFIQPPPDDPKPQPRPSQIDNVELRAIATSAKEEDWAEMTRLASINILAMKRRRKKSNVKASLDRGHAQLFDLPEPPPALIPPPVPSSTTIITNDMIKSSDEAILTEDWESSLRHAAANAMNMVGNKSRRKAKQITPRFDPAQTNKPPSTPEIGLSIRANNYKNHDGAVRDAMDKMKRTAALNLASTAPVTYQPPASSSTSTIPSMISPSTDSSPHCKLRSMHKTLLFDISFQIHDTNASKNGPNLYCHHGCCEHIFSISYIRQHHFGSDPPATMEYYPRNLLKQKRYVPVCEICKLMPTKFTTFDDCYTSHSPTYFCEYCYYMLHYDDEGRLAYDDFRVYPYS